MSFISDSNVSWVGLAICCSSPTRVLEYINQENNNNVWVNYSLDKKLLPKRYVTLQGRKEPKQSASTSGTVAAPKPRKSRRRLAMLGVPRHASKPTGPLSLHRGRKQLATSSQPSTLASCSLTQGDANNLHFILDKEFYFCPCARGYCSMQTEGPKHS